jgi:hypothetical protein
MATEQQLKPVLMEGVRLIFRNFKGEEGQYNREGVRNFGVILPAEIAEAMLNDGWNVKYLKPSEEEIAVDPQTGAHKCDLIVRPYFWTNAMGSSGIKAYLKSMFVTIEEDELDKKYAELNTQ